MIIGCERCERSLVASARWDDLSPGHAGSTYYLKPLCLHCFKAVHGHKMSEEKLETFTRRVTPPREALVGPKKRSSSGSRAPAGKGKRRRD